MLLDIFACSDALSWLILVMSESTYLRLILSSRMSCLNCDRLLLLSSDKLLPLLLSSFIYLSELVEDDSPLAPLLPLKINYRLFLFLYRLLFLYLSIAIVYGFEGSIIGIVISFFFPTFLIDFFRLFSDFRYELTDWFLFRDSLKAKFYCDYFSRWSPSLLDVLLNS